jgi:hypothetical protein
MALAAADFSTSMLSTSFGFRSARRFTTWSWLEPVLPLAREIAEAPEEMPAFEMMTPSTTNSGSP